MNKMFKNNRVAPTAFFMSLFIAPALISLIVLISLYSGPVNAASSAEPIDEPLSVNATLAVYKVLQSLAEKSSAINTNADTNAHTNTHTNTHTNQAAAKPTPKVVLLGANVTGNKITINLSKEIADYVVGSDDFEDALTRIHFEVDEALGNELARKLGGIEYVFQIDGVPLSEFFPETKGKKSAIAAAKLSSSASTTNPIAASPALAIAGRRVTISPGHGYYKNESGAWVLQREYNQGIVEDFVNAEMVMYLNGYLQAAGVNVRQARNLDKNAGNGISGFPKWQESAREHIRALGVPASVWDSSTVDLNDDIRARPLYANWIDANGFATDVVIGLHNNGGGGTGTETLYDTDNGFGLASKRFADIVHAKVIGAIRSKYNAAWVDRGVKGFAGSYGENRLATRPAILIEVAFMDKPTPDNAALQDENFKKIVTEAISQGIAEYFASITDTEPPSIPQAVAARGISDTQVKITWNTSTDNYDLPTYRILRDCVLISTTAASATPNFIDTTAVSGATYTYAVVASDASGNLSIASAAVSVTVPAPIAPVALSKRGGIDMDGDGKSKILLRAMDTQTSPALIAGRLVNNQFVFSNLIDPGANFRLVGTTDYDGNAKSDLVFQNISAPGEFGEVRAWNDFLPSNDRRIRDVKRVWDVQAVGDLDGDGFGDLVWRYVVSESPDTGVSYIWFTNVGGEPIVRKRGGAPLTWQLLGAADLNGDGAADMVYVSPSVAGVPSTLTSPAIPAVPSNIRVLMATANRTCANFSAGTMPLGFKALKLADFTGASRADMLIRNDATGAVSLLSLNAVGLALPPFTADPNDRNASCTSTPLSVDVTPITLPPTDAAWKFYAAGDFNGDGVTDIIWLRPDNTLTVWLMATATTARVVIDNAGSAPAGYQVFQP